MRAFGLILALGLLALTCSAGGGTQAVACERPAAASTAVRALPQAFLAVASVGTFRQPVAHLGHSDHEPSGHHHSNPSQHDHDCPDGCCPLCCAAFAPHVLMPQLDVCHPRPAGAVVSLACPAGVAKATAGSPFRPPRSAA